MANWSEAQFRSWAERKGWMVLQHGWPQDAQGYLLRSAATWAYRSVRLEQLLKRYAELV